MHSDIDNDSTKSQSAPILGKRLPSDNSDLFRDDSEKGLLKLSSV